MQNINVSLNVSKKFGDISIPNNYRKAGFMHLCPLPVHDQLELIKACSKYSMVSVDFNQVYEKEYKEKPHIAEDIIRNADFIFPNEFEARSITGTDNIRESAEILFNMGPSFVVIKLGAKGAALYDGDKLRLFPPQNAMNIVDPTGCGDAFIGGFLSTYIKTGDSDEAMKVANALAAKKIKKKGAWMIDHNVCSRFD
jgi:sugar/nucleoside kinase (ribokinase family)